MSTWFLSLSSAAAQVVSAPESLHRGFEYADIASKLIGKPLDLTREACREACVSNATCAAWELCTPLGDGCDGCYLTWRAPRRFTERDGWHAEVIAGREDFGWNSFKTADNMTTEECHEFLLNANGADDSEPFHDPETMQKYVQCGFKLRDHEGPRRVHLSGQHWPTFLVTDFWDPPLGLPSDMDQQMAMSGRQARQSIVEPQPQILPQLHEAVGTTSWDRHLRDVPRGPHAFVLPFFDTNIGHWVKQHGSMNPLQSYEMQSLLQAGDTVIDVGANLGCYTVPLAERVGPWGKVIAFEPFRWLSQMVSANVAINGLSNVWVLPVGLSTGFSRAEARPPQLRFFSSPGGMKMSQQTDGMRNEESMQLYDWDSPPEIITTVSLDEVLFGESHVLLGAPPVNDVRLIKIDVEGMEKEVIAGAAQVVQRFRPIIWTENVAYFSSNGQDTSLLALMEQLEYTCAKAQNAPNDVVCTDAHGRGHQIN